MCLMGALPKVITFEQSEKLAQPSVGNIAAKRTHEDLCRRADAAARALAKGRLSCVSDSSPARGCKALVPAHVPVCKHLHAAALPWCKP